MSLKALLEAQNIHIYFQLLKYAKFIIKIFLGRPFMLSLLRSKSFRCQYSQEYL